VRPRRRPRVAVGLAAILLLATPPARASDTAPQDFATATALFEQGSRLLDAGRYAEACPRLEAAQRLVQGIGVTLYLAECYEQTGRLVSAWVQFDKARALAESRLDRRAELARGRAASLWPRLPKLILVVPPGADLPGLVVTDDGEPVDHAAFNVERPAEQRTHHVRARAPDRTPWETAVVVTAVPDTTRVEVPQLQDSSDVGSPSTGGPAVLAPKGSDGSAASPGGGADRHAAMALPPLQSGRPSTQRVVGIALFGVGVAGLVTGAVFGLDAKSRMDDSNASGHCQPDNHCDATGLSERSSALTAATISTIGFIGGVAFLGGGAALYSTAPDDRPPVIGLMARSEHGGASVGLEGRW
jgi:hypothetical protein